MHAGVAYFILGDGGLSLRRAMRGEKRSRDNSELEIEEENWSRLRSK
jgi:hypothetical protein